MQIGPYLGLVTIDGASLVDLEGKIAERADPEREHGVHGSLGGRAQSALNLELLVSSFGGPENFGLEAFQVVLLLGQVSLGNQDGELNLVDTLTGPLLLEDVHNRGVHVEAVLGEDGHSLDRVALVHDVGIDQNAVVPLKELAFLVDVEGRLLLLGHVDGNAVQKRLDAKAVRERWVNLYLEKVILYVFAPMLRNKWKIRRTHSILHFADGAIYLTAR